MKITNKKKANAEMQTYLVLKDELPKGVNKALAKKLREEMNRTEFGKEGLETILFNEVDSKLLLVSLGKKEDYNNEVLRRASSTILKIAKASKVKSLTINSDENEVKKNGYIILESLLLTDYEFSTKSEKKKEFLTDIFIGAKITPEDTKKAEVITRAVNYVRDLVNNPANMITPEYLANEAKKIVKKNKLKLTLFGTKELKKNKMNAILAVGSGSKNEPRFAAIEYKHPKAKKKIAFVGKGICFDSGGLQIKPSASMVEMKTDMAGAALSLGLMKAVAELKLKVNLVCAFGAAENMLGNSAYKPGDIIKAYNGKTIEVQHTDAEGRLILADSLSYVEDHYKPDLIIDAATLTGACVVALGSEAAAIIGTTKKEIEQLKKIGDETYERVWELPFYKEYQKAMKSEVADLSNISKPHTGAGTITAAVFLKNFVKKTPWIHIDIAGVAYLSEAKYYVPKFASGFGVRLLTRFLEKLE